MTVPTIQPLRFPKSSLRIGIIGAGGIVQNAHLPGYRKAGYHVSAIADIREQVARDLARRFEISRVFTDARDLIASPEVDVIDMAIPEIARPGLVEAVMRARKPLLIQKPLAYTLARGREIVRMFSEARVPLAVNQNARFAPEFHAIKQLIESGALGQVFDIRWTMRNTSDHRSWARDSWYARDERFQILSWSIHHLDLFRHWLEDEALSVYCVLPRRPSQNFRGEIMASAVLRFRNGAHVSMIDSNACTPGRPEIQEVDVDGTKGSAYAKVSQPRAFRFWLMDERAGPAMDAPLHQPALEGEWYPDGFAASMGGFLNDLAESREPSVSGRRNLGTLELVEACYLSDRTGRPVDLAELP